MPTENYRGEWNPNLTYNGANDGQNFTGGDTVYWMGGTFGATYNTTDSNPYYQTGWQLIDGTTVNKNPAVPTWYPTTAAASSGASQANLHVSAMTDHSLTLTWNAALVPGAGEVTSYDVMVNGSRVGVTSGTAFTITNLAPATSYQVSVSATDAYGSSGTQSVMSKSSSPIELNVVKGANPSLTATTATDQISNKYYSPYIDVGLPGYDLYNVSKASGITSFTLAFQNSLYSALNPASYVHTAAGFAPALASGQVPSVGFGGLPAVNTPTGAPDRRDQPDPAQRGRHGHGLVRRLHRHRSGRRRQRVRRLPADGGGRRPEPDVGERQGGGATAGRVPVGHEHLWREPSRLRHRDRSHLHLRRLERRHAVHERSVQRSEPHHAQLHGRQRHGGQRLAQHRHRGARSREPRRGRHLHRGDQHLRPVERHRSGDPDAQLLGQCPRHGPDGPGLRRADRCAQPHGDGLRRHR